MEKTSRQYDPAQIDRQLREIEVREGAGKDARYYVSLSAEPAKLTDGLVAYADGTNWDPGHGEGLYMYHSGAWHPLTPPAGWRDITGAVNVAPAAANRPTWAQVGASAFYLWNFGVADQVWIEFHVPHDFDPSSNWHIHTHWMPDGTDANPVKWQWTYAYAKSHDQAAYTIAGTTISTQQAINATPAAYWHYTTESAAVAVDISEPDGIILLNVSRITNGAVENGDAIFMLMTDIHYQSTNKATISKEPNFYT